MIEFDADKIRICRDMFSITKRARKAEDLLCKENHQVTYTKR